MISNESAKKICATVANKMIGRNCDYVDDAMHEGFLYWWQYRSRYDTTRCQEATFVYRCAVWGVKRWLSQRQPMHPLRVPRRGWTDNMEKRINLEYHTLSADADGEIFECPNLSAREWDDLVDVQLLLNRVDARDRLIINKLLDGCNNSEIAKDIDGLTRAGVSWRFHHVIAPTLTGTKKGE